MKNILIFYGSYGGGHIAAAKSILEELNSKYDNINVEMIDCIEYINKFINKISTDTYKELAKNLTYGKEFTRYQKVDLLLKLAQIPIY